MAQVLKHLPGEREGAKKESKGDVRRGATAREGMEKSRGAEIIEREDMTQSNTSSQRGSEVPFESQMR